MALLKIPAVYYRGGTSKGIFFLQDDLRARTSASETRGEWRMEKAIMSRSARVIMEGRVSVPARILNP